MVCKNKLRPTGLLLTALLTAWCFAGLAAAAETAVPQGCVTAPKSPLVVDVRDKGAKGDGHTDDTEAIQAAIDEVGGTGGTVLVPGGTYMVDAVKKKQRLSLKSDMTLKLAKDAVLKAIPNDFAQICRALDFGRVGRHRCRRNARRRPHRAQGQSGRSRHGHPHRQRRQAHHHQRRDLAQDVGDGFYVEGAKDTKFCGVIADNNRRQGLSIVEADGVLVTDLVFRNTRGTRPSAGIDLEPDHAEQKIVNVRIQNSKFIDNAGPGIEIAGKRGAVAKVELARNMFRGNRPILVENAPAVLASAICENRQVSSQTARQEGPYAFADAVDVVVHQNDCGEGSDMRFEVNRNTRKKKK